MVGGRNDPRIFVPGEVVGGHLLGDDAVHQRGGILDESSVADIEPEETDHTIKLLSPAKGLRTVGRCDLQSRCTRTQRQTSHSLRTDNPAQRPVEHFCLATAPP